jgi:hypothetical protein
MRNRPIKTAIAAPGVTFNADAGQNRKHHHMNPVKSITRSLLTPTILLVMTAPVPSNSWCHSAYPLCTETSCNRLIPCMCRHLIVHRTCNAAVNFTYCLRPALNQCVCVCLPFSLSLSLPLSISLSFSPSQCQGIRFCRFLLFRMHLCLGCILRHSKSTSH